MIEKLRLGITNWVRQAMYWTGMFGLFHRWRNSNTLTVLMFHRVLPEDSDFYRNAEREFTFSLEGFIRCIDFVKKHYNVIDLQTLLAAGTDLPSLPRRAALITFDDGWRDTFLYALPALEKRRLPAVLFLATEPLDLPDSRWWQDQLSELAQSKASLSSIAKELGHTTPELAHFHEVSALLAALPYAQRHELISKYVATETSTRQMLSRADITALRTSQISIAAHGHTHAPLTKVMDLQAELLTSSSIISKIGGESSVMSLPHGQSNSRVLNAARNAGFKWIFTSAPRLISTMTPSRALIFGRIHMPESSWTLGPDGISPAYLASFLFFRPIDRPNLNELHTDQD